VGRDSSVGIATSYELYGLGIESQWGEIFCTNPDHPRGPPSLLYNGSRVFPGGKMAGAWRWSSTPSSVEVEERVQLYLYSTSGLSWPVLGWTLPLPLSRRHAGWMELWLYTFLDFALTGAEWSASGLSGFTHSSFWVGWCMGLHTGLDILEVE